MCVSGARSSKTTDVRTIDLHVKIDRKGGRPSGSPVDRSELAQNLTKIKGHCDSMRERSAVASPWHSSGYACRATHPILIRAGSVRWTWLGVTSIDHTATAVPFPFSCSGQPGPERTYTETEKSRHCSTSSPRGPRAILYVASFNVTKSTSC